MGDIAVRYQENFADLVIERTDLAQDEGLETACLISLFTDARVNVEELPVAETDRRGWWGDMFADVEGDQIGSKLWLLAREKRTTQTLKRFEDYAREALAWLQDDGVAESVAVVASYPRAAMVGLEIAVTRPQGRGVYKFSFAWKAEEGKR